MINYKILGLILILGLLILPVTATLNITPESIGDTFISWRLESGINITGIYIDDIRMCGFESTDPLITFLGFAPSTCHEIVVFNASDGATNISCTTGTTTTIYSGGSNNGGETYIIIGVIIGLFFGTLIIKRRFIDK